MSTFHALTIQKIIKETSDAISVQFAVPSELKDNFSFVAGQYITIKKTIDKKEIRRSYSICSSPDSGELKVAIKAIKNGVFSNYALSKLKVGDILDISEPEGKFLLEPQAGKKYIAFAAGSGITPVMAMIKATLEREKTALFTLIYGNKSAESTIFKSELDQLAIAYPQQFKYHEVFSKSLSGKGIFGRIDRANTNYFIKNIYKNTVFDAAFLCGPEDMIQTVSKALEAHDFDEDKIFFELFTASTETAGLHIPDGKTEITVMLDDEEIIFTMEKTDTILAAALRHNLDAPYSCQGGVCSSCIAKVTEGKAVMEKNSILTDGELEEGFVLTCQAHPTTAKIAIDYDDV